MGDADALIRPGRPADLAWIPALLAQSAGAAQWVPGAESFLVAEPQSGILVWRETGAGEFEILNLAVEPAARRRGLAVALVQAACRSGRWFLEVRESNSAARALYAKCGFREAGLRRGYYTGPVENAIVLLWEPC